LIDYTTQIEANESEKRAVRATIEELKDKTSLYKKLAKKNLENIKKCNNIIGKGITLYAY